MSKDKIILIGGGGHCLSAIDVIEQENKYEIAGIIDVSSKIGEEILKYKILGADNDLPRLIKKFKNCCITVGQIKSAKLRKTLYEKAKECGAIFPIIKSPFSYRSNHATIGEGTIIMHAVCINVGATIGRNCIINTKANIEHGVQIGDFCHISTAAIVNGDCKVGEEVFIGSNATLMQNIEISNGKIIQAGRFVSESI